MSRAKGARYPSDHRRYVRVMEDILDNPKLNGDCPPEVAWFFIRLLATMNRMSSAGTVSLDRRALMACTCREQHRHALRVARACAARGLCSLSEDPPHTVITVHNYLELQYDTPKKPRRSPDETPPPIPTPIPSPTPTPKETPPAVIWDGSPEIVKLWSEVNLTRDSYLPGSTGLGLDQTRIRRMKRVLKDYGPTAPVDAFHGYVIAAGCLKPPRDGWEPWSHFVPDTVWRPSNIQKYLDADAAAQAAGLTRPYTAEQITESGDDASEARIQRILAARGAPLS